MRHSSRLTNIGDNGYESERRPVREQAAPRCHVTAHEQVAQQEHDAVDGQLGREEEGMSLAEVHQVLLRQRRRDAREQRRGRHHQQAQLVVAAGE